MGFELSAEDRRKLDEIKQRAAVEKEGTPNSLPEFVPATIYADAAGVPLSDVLSDLQHQRLSGKQRDGVSYISVSQLPLGVVQGLLVRLDDIADFETAKTRISNALKEERRAAEKRLQEERSVREQQFLCVTVAEIPGRRTLEALGTVSGDAAVANNIFSRLAQGVRDLVGGSSGSLQKRMRKARASCMAQMREQALSLGADAVVGTRFELSEFSGNSMSMLLMSAAGTAVRTRDSATEQNGG